MNWDTNEDTFLSHRYSGTPIADLAEVLARSKSAVKQRARKLGLSKPSRFISEDAKKYVRENYSKQSAKEIAEHLFGDASRLSAVYQIAHRSGLRKVDFWPDDVLDLVRRENANGLTDASIGRKYPDIFPSGRDNVHPIRRRLRLPANKDTKDARACKRRAVENQLKTLGLESPTQLRTMAFRKLAERYGLPPELKPVQVRIVLALLSGPKTLPEIKAAIGKSPKFGMHCNASVHSADSSYTAVLAERGLIFSVSFGSGGRTRGPRRRYALTAACLELLSQAGGKAT